MTNEELLRKISVVIKYNREKNMLQADDIEKKLRSQLKTLEEHAEYMLYLINHEAFQEQDTECLKAAYLRSLKCIEEQKRSEIY